MGLTPTDHEIARLVDERRRLYRQAIREKRRRGPAFAATIANLEHEAAEIKLRLYRQGIVLHDTATGTSWSRAVLPAPSAEVK